MSLLRTCARCAGGRLRRRPSRCAVTDLAALLLALLVLAGCSVPTDNEARAIDPGRLEANTTTKRTCALPGVDGQPTELNVFLVSQQDDPPNVKPVRRTVEDAGLPSAFAALEALFECIVTQEDLRSGLASAIPEQTNFLAVRAVNPDDGLYEVQLGPLRNRAGQNVDDLDRLAVAQIFFTATGSDPAVKGLRFVIDGRPAAVNTDRRTVGQAETVTREDFIASSPPTMTGTTSTATTRPTTSVAAAPGPTATGPGSSSTVSPRTTR